MFAYVCVHSAAMKRRMTMIFGSDGSLEFIKPEEFGQHRAVNSWKFILKLLNAVAHCGCEASL